MTNREFNRLVRRVAERRVIRVIKASNEGLNTIAKPGEGCRHLSHWRKVHTRAHAQNLQTSTANISYLLANGARARL